ncbi:MAG: HAD hydrolase family protein [Bacteroidetes bacterium]|nr:HAD hydrolase family protein [Bacteroidota bacterium]
MNSPSTTSLNPQLLTRLRRIKAFLLDVDGVLTDAAIRLTPDGLETKVFNMMDSESITAAQNSGVRIGIITTHAPEVVLQRARELHIHDIYHGSYDKVDAYEEFKQLYDFEDEEVAFMGDGILDLGVLRQVGFAATPSNAHSSARMAAHFVSRYQGGHGAVREVLNMLVQVRRAQDF